MKNVNNVKFVSATEETEEMNVVLWVDDIEEDIKEFGLDDALENVIDNAFSGELVTEGQIVVIDDNAELAGNIASMLNAKFTEAAELLVSANKTKKQAKAEVEKMANENKGTVEQEEVVANKGSKAAARKFFEEQSGKILAGKQAQTENKEETKEEEAMSTNKTQGGSRRKLNSGATQTKEENKMNTNTMVNQNENKQEEMVEMENKQVKGNGRRSSSAGEGKTTVSTRKQTTGRRLARTESIRNTGFKRHEGNWYTNASLYPALNRLDQILDNMEAGEYVDAELGIEQIVFVEPTDIRRYENREDIDVVVQVKANGNILEFPIKDAAANSKSDLTSTSIGWVEGWDGKIRPAFGFYRPNALEVEVKCSCGNNIKANTGYVRCRKCNTRHDDIVVEMESKLDFVGDFQNFVFQTIPNLVVPAETLALVMALAQYDAGYDMDGLLEEDAE